MTVSGANGTVPRQVSWYRKGEGQIIDDTLMTGALVAVYQRLRRQLNAYDADSIASIAGALAGVLNRIDAVPTEWPQGVATASRKDIEAPGQVMAAAAREMFVEDKRRGRAAEAAFEELAGEGTRAADLGTA